MPKNKQPLNPKQARFVEEYLVDCNGTQAAIRAGYSKKTANEQSSALLAKPHIQDALKIGLHAKSERAGITAERVLQELARVAFGTPRDLMTWGANGVVLKESETLTEDQVAQVSEVSESESQFGGSLKIKRHDKVKALELLGRHLGMFKDKLELGGPGGAPVPVAVVPSDIKAINEAIENAC